MGNETPNRGGSEAPPRSPTLKDLTQICAELNRLGAKYVVIGGFAMIQAGYARTTEDIDLLVETTPENEARVIPQGMNIAESQISTAAANPFAAISKRLKRIWDALGK